jgi:hypothetical protein
MLPTHPLNQRRPSTFDYRLSSLSLCCGVAKKNKKNKKQAVRSESEWRKKTKNRKQPGGNLVSKKIDGLYNNVSISFGYTSAHAHWE